MKNDQLIDIFAQIRDSVFALSDCGFEGDRWQEHRIAEEGRNSVAMRLENEICELLEKAETILQNRTQS